jgi:trk system potassium uptake protein TrkA
VIKVERKFIRLRNTYFSQSNIKEKLGISETIFPLQRTSETVASLLDYPKANNVKQFTNTDLKLISVRASNPVELTTLLDENCQIIGVERNKHFFVPQQGTQIEKNDLVYFFGKPEAILRFSEMLETLEFQSIERCVIFGAGDVGVSIAKALKANNRKIKVIDKDIELCKIADEALEGAALTINSKYGTEELFEEEGLAHADMMIAATDNDEYNIIKCLEAKEHGIPKVVAIINELEYYNLMHALGIVVVRGPKMNAYNEIMERIYSSNIVMERKFCGGKANIYLRKIFKDSPLITKAISPMKEQKSVAYLVREERLHLLDKSIQAQEGDMIIAFCTSDISPKVKRWIDGL